MADPNKPDSNQSKKIQQDFEALALGAKSLSKNVDYISDSLKEAASRLKDMVKIQRSLTGEMNQSITASAQLAKFAKNNLQISKDVAAVYDMEADVYADLLLKQNIRNTGLTGEYANLLTTFMIENKISDMNDKRVKQMARILKERQELNDHVKDQLELEEAVAEQVLEIREEAEKYKKSFEKVLATSRAIANDPKAMGAFVLTRAVEKVEEFAEGFEELHKQGLSAGQAIEGQFKGLSLMSLLGLSDTKGVLAGVVEEYGNINALSRGIVDDLGQMAHHFGISGQEALKLNASLSQMPGETSETAAYAMEHVGHMAELQGIAPGKIMGDMAKNTEAMALFSRGGAEQFGKSAIALHKMGVEIATASKMASNLLDYENSINSQMEASVLLGKEINFDKARELALNGDIEGSTAEILRNIGGSAEFDKMNVLQKQKLAEATGMTVEEMQKAIDAQEESNKYYGEQASLMDNVLGKTMEIGAGVGGFLKENGMDILAIIQFLQAQNLTKIKGYASDVAHWAKEKAHLLWKATIGKVLGKGGGDLTEQVPKGEKTTATADKMKGGGGFAKSMKGVASGLKAMGTAQVTLGILNLALAGPALIVALLGIPFLALIAAIGIPIGIGLKGLAKGLSALADPLVAAGVGILSLLVLSVGAGMMMFGIGVGVAAAGMSLLVTSLQNVPFENLIAMPIALMGIATGLGMMAVAGLAALPVIGALTALAVVAPALVGLGAAMSGMFGGGGKEEDKMDTLIGEIRELKVIASKGGEIKMDGKKVGDVLRLGLNTSNVR